MAPFSPPSDTTPMSLNELLAFLTSNGLPGSLAMKVTPALMRSSLNSRGKLGKISEATCVQLGVDDKDSRKALIALAKRARTSKGRKKFTRDADLDRPLAQASTSAAGSSSSLKSDPVSQQPTFDFREHTDEWFLQTQRCKINRAPVMCAWATVVAERLSFSREEALSIAQSFTERNANSRAVAQGIHGHAPAPKTASSTQPYVDLMGRRIYLLGLQDGSYRALGTDGKPIEPDRAWGYLTRSFAQQLSAAIGSMRLLADSFEPSELNDKGYGLYSEFRPKGGGWGEKSELKYIDILDLRRYLTHVKPEDPQGAVAPSPGESEVKQEDEQPEQLPDPAMQVKQEEAQDVKPSIPVKVEPESPGAEGRRTAPNEPDEFDAMLDDDLDLSNVP